MDGSSRTTKTNRNDQLKNLYSVKEIKESSDDVTTDDVLILEYPGSEVNSQRDKEQWVTAKRGRKQKKTNPANFAPLITMGKDVDKPWSRSTINKPYIPDMMQVSKQTFYSIIALAVQQEVVQQIDFTPLTKIRQANDDNPQELYEKIMMTAKENCGLSQVRLMDFHLVTC